MENEFQKNSLYEVNPDDSTSLKQLGYDELNLAEFPLAAISDRFLDGTKTVVFEDSVWDRAKNKRMPRTLTISGSDRYGLPTAKDDDVLLACIQLSSFADFRLREVHFSRYELLKLLRWKDETRNYRRLATALRRWKGLTVYSDRTFFDKARESWVSRDFGIFDNLYIYEREIDERNQALASSSFVWNEVLLNSFQAGYLKRLDWDLHCSLNSPVAKRLYRFLDKRFYHGNHVEINLHELAFNKLRLSRNYNVAQIKRELVKGIQELESSWQLKPLETSKRFIKEGRGRYKVVFDRRRRNRRIKKTDFNDPNINEAIGLEAELIKRSVGPAMAHELASNASAIHITTAIELYDWYNNSGRERDVGFLVNSIRRPEQLRLPKGFESSVQKYAKQQQKVEREKRQYVVSRRQEAKRKHADQERERPFREHWESLTDDQRQEFESEAVNLTDATKRQGYFRSMGKDDQIFKGYRAAILHEHFRKLSATKK